MILDTCALLWLAQGGGALSDQTRAGIASKAIVYVSAISGFEVGIKHRKGKLLLPLEPVAWLQAVVAHHDLQVIPLDLEICAKSTSLPNIHQDPCDRLLIATAIIHRLTIVTADSVIAEYGVITIV